MNNFKTFFFLEIDSYLKCDNHPSLVQHQKDTLVTNPYIQGTQECTHTGYTGVYTYRAHRSAHIQECTRTGHTGVHTYRVHRSVYIQGMYTGHTFLFHWSLCLCGSKTALIMKLKDV